MSSSPLSNPDNFDDHGQLKAPVLFWVGIIVLARAWWLSGLISLMTPDVNTDAGFLWPDIRFSLLALAAGIPGIIMLFIYPVRARLNVFSRAVYVLILAGVFVMLATDISGLVVSRGSWDVGWIFLCLDVAGVVMLWPDSWLRTIFFQKSVRAE